MKLEEISKKMNEIKVRYGRLHTNVIWTNISEVEEGEAFFSENGIVFVVQEPHRRRAYYAVSDMSELVPLLHRVESGVVLEFLHREEINQVDNYFLDAGFDFYKKYMRVTTCYCKNPYEIPETGRRALLPKMYDAACGEYPMTEDAQELYELTKNVFDPLTDDVFTVKEWEDIIQEKRCLVCRDDGKIFSYYVWRVEGKKMYRNMSLNMGPANYLYNMERRAFEAMWEKGIRVYYGWVDMSNHKARYRSNENVSDCIKSYSKMFNSIYIKE